MQLCVTTLSKEALVKFCWSHATDHKQRLIGFGSEMIFTSTTSKLFHKSRKKKIFRELFKNKRMFVWIFWTTLLRSILDSGHLFANPEGIGIWERHIRSVFDIGRKCSEIGDVGPEDTFVWLPRFFIANWFVRSLNINKCWQTYGCSSFFWTCSVVLSDK